ncbi:hypothetical protein RND71_022814 [Anisodus tanguticus]|uniref:Protein FAR1-RELATED SEQUENCE n=1 Tax=Anisodus tanguticus TaxID=243964 RepID=A0AAE1VD95_9SOLA|nr:hypothetical protein RND71_022814 [Anisodus tanguticus]
MRVATYGLGVLIERLEMVYCANGQIFMTFMGITRRDFTCHRGGYPQLKPSEDGKLQRNRKSSRCGCQAFMRIVKRADFNVAEWRITGFSSVHNHELLKSTEVQLIPAYCTMSPDDKSRICMFAKAGISVRQMLRLMELEKGVKLGCLPFTEIDVRNLLQSFRNVDQDNDPIDLLRMCKEMKDKDPNCKYDYKIDYNSRLEHIAWSYASSIRLYEAFGDAIVFDTTHRLDAYDMLLGIWIGVDNHGSHCFFGCVLLRDENLQSFSWALKTFLGFMNGKAPGTILTDQNLWLEEAIATEIPRVKHAFCIWNIISRFSDWFSTLLGSQYDNWKADFHRLYNLHSIEDFEVGWNEMVETYRLDGNKHIVSRVVDAKDQAGSKHQVQRNVQMVPLKTGSPIESHAATVLTSYAFSKLQEELVLAPQYASLMVDESYFIVRHHKEMDGGYKVLWVPHDEFISCSCHNFEFTGILCRHVLRVLSTNNCFHIPHQYLPVRWREFTSSLTKPTLFTLPSDHMGKVQLLQSMISTLITESVETEERLNVVCDEVSTVIFRIKGFPTESNGGNAIAYESPSDSLILAVVEESEGIGQSFTCN